MAGRVSTIGGFELVGIRLPNLAATNCVSLVVYGSVQTKNPTLLRWIKRQPSILARYRSGKESAYVFASFGGDNGNSFELEASLGPPIETQRRANRLKVSDFQARIERLLSERMKAVIEGFFFVENEDLPPIVRSALFETEADGVSIKSTSGELSVRGAPINLIEWHVNDDGDALIRLLANREMIIDESYLESALSLVDSAFETLLRGGQRDVRG